MSVGNEIPTTETSANSIPNNSDLDRDPKQSNELNPTNLKVGEELHLEDKLGRNIGTVLKPHDGQERSGNTLVQLDVRDLNNQSINTTIAARNSL